MCFRILKEIEEKYINIPLVKKIVERGFSIWLNKKAFKENSDREILEGRFSDFLSVLDDYCNLTFRIELTYNYIAYKFNIASISSQLSSSLLQENLNTINVDLIDRFDKELLAQIQNTSKNKYRIYSQKKIDLKVEPYPIYNIHENFKNFIILSLLVTQENPIHEIDYILNHEEKKRNSIKNMKPQETYIEEKELNQYIKTLKRKKHIIFKGSPGTGKTYLAKHIANYLTSSGDGFYELIQFHPSYSYEDFIQGIRPQTSSDGNLKYSMIPGRFLKFCKKAENCEDMCILIIDEINRTNLSQVFGELMYLLEYREEKIKLAGSDQEFKIPKNVYIIGTMNTADRSIALVDHALRRRFAFIAIKPNYDILRKYHKKHNPNYDIESLINILKELNQTINDRHYEIGVSFFLTETLPEDLEDIWIMEIEPYLEEYFFDETDKIDKFRWRNISNKLNL